MTGTTMHAADALLLAGALAGALTAIGIVVRAGFKLARKTSRFLDQWEGTGEQAGVPQRLSQIEQKLETIDGELKTNGGSSTKDAAIKAGRLAQQTHDKVDKLAAQLNEHINSGREQV